MTLQLLKVGELASIFTATAGWKILVDSVMRTPDGRPLNTFLAQKLQSSSPAVTALQSNDAVLVTAAGDYNAATDAAAS